MKTLLGIIASVIFAIFVVAFVVVGKLLKWITALLLVGVFLHLFGVADIAGVDVGNATWTVFRIWLSCVIYFAIGAVVGAVFQQIAENSPAARIDRLCKSLRGRSVR